MLVALLLLLLLLPPAVGSYWYEPGRIYCWMTSVEVPLDMIHVNELAQLLGMPQMLDVSIEVVV